MILKNNKIFEKIQKYEKLYNFIMGRMWTVIIEN